MTPLPSADQLPYFAALLDHTEDAIMLCDANWRVTLWNGGARRMLGWTAEEVVGQPPTLLGLAENDGDGMDRRRQLAEYGRWREGTTVERKDGTEVPVDTEVIAVRDPQARITGYLGILRDVGVRKRAEEALRASNERADGILQRVSDTFFAVDDQWRYTYVNDRAVAAARKAWGREVNAEDLLGKNCWELFPEHLGTAFDRELHRAVREQHKVEFEAYSVLASAWVEVRAYPASDGLSVYSRDVTERRRGRDALANQASVLDNLEDGIIVTDADDFRITAWNKGAERVYGLPANEVLGRPAREVASFPGDESRLTLERQLLEAGRARIEFTARRPDGTPVRVDLLAVAVKDSGGEITSYLGIHRDVTERKQAEGALRAAQQRSQMILERITDAFVALDRGWRVTYVNELALRRIRTSTGRQLTREEVVGANICELLRDTADKDIFEKTHEAVRSGRPAEFETYFARGDEWLHIHLYPSDSGVSIYVRDITEGRRATEQQERRLRQQAAVAELGLRALADGKLRPLMDEATTLVCRTLGVDYAKVDELLPGGQQVLVSAGAGLREGIVGSVTMPTGRGSPAGYALMIGQPVIVEDMAAETRFDVPAILREHEVMSDITVVIDPGGNPFGALVAMSRNRRSFSEDDVSFMQAVANVLATAVQRGKAEERLASVREAERGRIARALHDEALQGLSAAIALAAGANRPPAEARLAGQLLPVLRQVGEQLRFAIYDLRIENEEHASFAELVQQLVDAHRALAGDCEIELDIGEGVLSESIGPTGTEVLLIVGEALTNARSHAEAGRVRVRVWSANGRLWVEVSDDGRGFDTARPVSPIHHGVTGMRERAELMSGRLEVHSEAGVGTTVRLEMPLPEGASADT
jgi:PAS domain S-box-containing protein